MRGRLAQHIGGRAGWARGRRNVNSGDMMEPKGLTGEQGLDQSAIHLLHRAGQCASDIFANEMAGDGLTPRQFAVLVAVAGNEGRSQTDLVQATGIDRSTLADIIRRMLKKGLLSRKRTRADARAYAVRLTQQGRDALSSARPGAKNADTRILAALPPGRREEFLSLLATIVRCVERA